MRGLVKQHWKRYGLALLLVAAAAALRALLPVVLGSTPYLAFYPAVVAAAALGGCGPGVLATALSFLCVDLVFDETPGRIEIDNPIVLARLAVFFAGGVGISIVAGMKRTLQAREQQHLQELGDFASITDLGHFLIRDQQDRITRWSHGCTRLYGFTAEQALGRSSHELLKTAFPEPLEKIRAALQQNGRWEGELAHVAADGHIVNVASLWVLRQTAAGAEVLEINNDITEQKRAEAELRESEQRLRASFRNAALGILEVDTQDRILLANERMCRMLGYSCGELVGKTVHEITAPEDRDRSDDANQALYDCRSERIDYEKRYVRGDGSRLWVHVTVSCIRDAQGRHVRSIGTVEDISQRKEAEAQLRLHATALEAAANGIVITDAAGTMLWVNPAFSAMTGFSKEEAVGRNPRILKSGKQDADFYRRLWETIRLGRIWHGELVNRRKDGTLYYEDMTIAPVKDEQGRITHFISIKQDVTHRRRAEEDLIAAKVSAEQAKAAAEQANQAKDHFLAVLSHELRTPLTPVLTTASLLEQEPELPTQHRADVQMIRRNVELEARLIDDLLDVTRIAKGKIELELRPVPLGEVIRRAAEVCQADIEARGLHFGIDPGNAGAAVVHGDAARLQQVFWNLLKNSIKFTPHGGCVGVRCYLDNGSVVAEVNDSGEGIDAKVLPEIFKPFEQGGRGITRQFGGLGLGLTITKGLVEMHGGTIRALSNGKGTGSSFQVRLPVLTGELQDASASPQPVKLVLPDGIRSLRILVVEDHGDTARIMKRLLARSGHQVETAGDVATALELALRQEFDLLLSDLGLPDGSGFALVSELRQRGRSFPAIALSGYGQEQDIRRAREAGFAAHLTKPVSPQRLNETIAQVVGRSQAGAVPPRAPGDL